MDIGNQLKFAREFAGLKQVDVMEKTKISNKTLSNWENNVSKPSTDDLNSLSKLYDLTIDFLVGNVQYPNSPQLYKRKEIKHEKGVKIPVLGRVVAGIPLEAITDIVGYEEISESMAKKGEYFALKIIGQSMSPFIQESDVVIVKKQPSIESGEIAIILINGQDATIKQVYLHENGIMLQAFNSAVFPPRFYSNDEIEQLPVTILGKVIELRRKLK
ncbi:helix-turn-helix domain-containing protein [Pectinatus frisingensis]|uniref:helix-turn-helix domain-containing protein n=1 Tax=Pectinatus frisingensis TaxID=865 RepID=UPI0018C56B0E|nr:S24 family peptidase [Pectinatus frisingensis]